MIAIAFGAVFLWICFTTSSREDIAAARRRQHPYDKIAGAVALLIVLSFILTG